MIVSNKAFLSPDFVKQREKERIEDLKAFVTQFTDTAVMPLYLIFWICDIFYVPHLKWEFLFLRLLTIPICYLARKSIKKSNTLNSLQNTVLLFILGLSSVINIMIVTSNDSYSLYYGGLNLLAIGTIILIPLSRNYIIGTLLSIYLPYFLVNPFFNAGPHFFTTLLVNSFFISGTIIISLFIRIFSENLRKKELLSRMDLKDEIVNREVIIIKKTQEALDYSLMSQQFSPQIVDAILDKTVTIEANVHREEICSIFIDIVNSTERVTRLDSEQVNKVISMFLEDTNKILLKYDITIDKFLGDGILAFSNAPVPQSNYTKRVIDAALEIREKIKSRSFIYENYWLNDLEITIGIAKGYANVGFYGSQKYYHSYTAIGPVVNLSSRLCSLAQPGEILVPYSIVEELGIENYEFQYLGKKSLKGFEKDSIKVYSLIKASLSHKQTFENYDCPTCETVMHLDQDSDGHFVFKCRKCNYILTEDDLTRDQYKKSA